MHAELIPSAGHASAQESYVPVSRPEPFSLTLISLSPLVVGGRMLGAVVVYDDPITKRPADYLELYDGAGELVAVGWFDKFGIQRMAVDRALVEGRDQLEGVFVVLLDGDSV
jgi:hypothetical protein